MPHLPDAPVSSSLSSLTAEGALAQQKNSGSIVTEFFEDGVPDFAIAALDRIHGSLYSSMRHLVLCGAHRPAPCAWVCYQQGEISSVLLFRIESASLLVLSEMVLLSAAQVNAFARSVFQRYRSVKQIRFHAVCLGSEALEFCSQRIDFSENYILDLPGTVTQYWSSLGKATRKTIKTYGNKLQRDFPDFSWRACRAEELPLTLQQSLVQQLQAFKQASMAARNKVAAVDAAETTRMLQLAAESGLFGIATINGETRAGSLACRIGDSYVMWLSAADPALEHYRLGLLVCYWSVCDCIAAGGRQSHLLWGRYQYKTQLGAVRHPMSQLCVNRSVWQFLRMPVQTLKMTFARQRFVWRSWLLYDVHESTDSLSRCIARAVRWVQANRKRRLATLLQSDAALRR